MLFRIASWSKPWWRWKAPSSVVITAASMNLEIPLSGTQSGVPGPDSSEKGLPSASYAVRWKCVLQRLTEMLDGASTTRQVLDASQSRTKARSMCAVSTSAWPRRAYEPARRMPWSLGTRPLGVESSIA